MPIWLAIGTVETWERGLPHHPLFLHDLFMIEKIRSIQTWVCTHGRKWISTYRKTPVSTSYAANASTIAHLVSVPLSNWSFSTGGRSFQWRIVRSMEVFKCTSNTLNREISFGIIDVPTVTQSAIFVHKDAHDLNLKPKKMNRYNLIPSQVSKRIQVTFYHSPLLRWKDTFLHEKGHFVSQFSIVAITHEVSFTNKPWTITTLACVKAQCPQNLLLSISSKFKVNGALSWIDEEMKDDKWSHMIENPIRGDLWWIVTEVWGLH